VDEREEETRRFLSFRGDQLERRFLGLLEPILRVTAEGGSGRTHVRVDLGRNDKNRPPMNARGGESDVG
jgi:hypothetical protein